MMPTMYGVCAILACLGLSAAQPDQVRVLDGPEVKPMREALQRVGCAFADLKSLDEASLVGCRVLVVCGTRPPIDETQRPVIARFVKAGGGLLATGGGAGRLIELGLFDAETYYMCGTTSHNASFDGYHRITFGYPDPNPPPGGTGSGVSWLFRATQGPLMRPGPKATSVIAAGGGYSLAAVQRLGKGWLVCFGADPQGGQFLSDVGKSSRVFGSKYRTEGLLANAIAFLRDPRGNLMPNPGFEEFTDRSPDLCHWEIASQKGARHQWCNDAAPEGKQYLKLVCAESKANTQVRPLHPIVVEPGQSYTLACQYKSTVPWNVAWQWWKTPRSNATVEAGPTVAVVASAEWQQFETRIVIPPGVPYVKPMLRIAAQGELCLDAVTLRLD